MSGTVATAVINTPAAREARMASVRGATSARRVSGVEIVPTIAEALGAAPQAAAAHGLERRTVISRSAAGDETTKETFPCY